MCGTITALHTNLVDCQVEADMHEALYLLQHRGHDACGLATCAAGSKIYENKGNGVAVKMFL